MPDMVFTEVRTHKNINNAARSSVYQYTNSILV